MKKEVHDSETPAHGQQVISVCAFIHHDFGGVVKMFSPRRAKTKKFLPGVWEIPGGHIDFGEDIVEGLKREIKEELNMDIKVGDLLGAFTYVNPVKGSHTIQVTYFATFTSPLKNIKLNPEDHSEYTWFAESEIDKIYDDKEVDPEEPILRKGFKLLKGEDLNFG